MMTRRMRSDEGISTLEFALVLPLLLILLAVSLPILRSGWEYLMVSRAGAHGIRYATKVDANARCEGSVDAYGVCTGELRRNPSVEEVEAFVRKAASPVGLAAVSVTPEPASALPGELVTLRITREFSNGALADIANGVHSLLGGSGELLPESRSVTVTVQGRQE